MASRKSTSRIPIDKVNQLIHNCSVGFDSVEFCWHGGEPLLVGKDFYLRVLESQKSVKQSTNIKFQNVIQSNGSLISDEWLDFFQANEIRVGLSFDAPPHVHRTQRPSTNESIDIEQYFSLFKRIKERSLPLGLLCVVTKSNVSLAEEIFQFFSEIGAESYSLLPLISVPSELLPEVPSNDELFDLFKKTFDLWLNSNHSFKCIEPIDSMVQSIVGAYPRLCTYASSCLKRMVAIIPTGEIVPCGSLVSDSFVLGNAFEDTVYRAIHTPKAKALRVSRAEAVKKWCKNCDYISICRGGCRENAYWSSHNYQGCYPYCEARKRTFDYIRDTLNEMLCSKGNMTPPTMSQEKLSPMEVCNGS
ncbi:MAG: radical SAM protein [Bacteroidota bacterium]